MCASGQVVSWDVCDGSIASVLTELLGARITLPVTTQKPRFKDCILKHTFILQVCYVLLLFIHCMFNDNCSILNVFILRPQSRNNHHDHCYQYLAMKQKPLDCPHQASAGSVFFIMFFIILLGFNHKIIRFFLLH